MADSDQTEFAVPADSELDTLERHLTLGPAVALAVTTVIGGGALALPGVALRQAGSAAIIGWLLAAAITVPLLLVFAQLGSRYPSAGGVAGFVQAAFGRCPAAGVEVMLIGTFGLGIPAISLSGGSYLTTVLNLSPQLAWIGALILLALAAVVLLVGGTVSSRVQFVLAIVLTLGLALTGIIGLTNGHAHFTAPALSGAGWTQSIEVVGIVFFGFTGWEMVAFTTGEYRNPKRDFPRAVAISFLVVVGVYVLLAAGVQATLSPSDPTADTSPVAALMRTAVSPAAASVVSLLGVVILGANLIGAMWGASRLVFSSASEGLLPRPLASLSGPHRAPRTAILTVFSLFVIMVGASGIGLITPTTMFMIAGQNFFLLYLFAAVVFVRVAKTGLARAFGIVVTILLAAVAVTGFQPLILIYPVILLLFGAAMALVVRKQSDSEI